MALALTGTWAEGAQIPFEGSVSAEDDATAGLRSTAAYTRETRSDPVIERGRHAPPAAQTWRIASAAGGAISTIDGRFTYGWLREHLLAVFFEMQYLEVKLWQWISLVSLVPLAAGVAWLAAAVLLRLARPLMRHFGWEGRLLTIAAGPLRLAIAVSVFGAGAATLSLAAPVAAFIGTLGKVLAFVSFTWLVVRGVDVGVDLSRQRMLARGQTASLSAISLARRVAQVLVISLASIALLQNLGINVTGVLAGLGIGGLVVALAAQKTVENLFGGATLIADQPVRVGDFCRFNGTLGTVEEIGLRSTRVRTLERTVVTLPNAQFAAMALENFSRRDRIWFHTTIGLRYETTSDQLRWVLLELKKLLLGHPRVHPEPARARFVGFGAYSLDIELFAYITTSDINEFLAIREDLFLRIMDVVETSGSSFAFPSQTIYAAADVGLNSEKGEAVEAQVRQWREASALGLPDFRPDQLAALADQLDYPPRGSATRS
jgi:MscS family membrane protein